MEVLSYLTQLESIGVSKLSGYYCSHWSWRLCKGLEPAMAAIGVGDFVRDLIKLDMVVIGLGDCV